ncbi:MAG: tetratricopeptide repeat protein [Deltaproteobacteria bacterium]|nr:tetratricopeptide repeat protein [Deltaproteobacteria bacterium]
MSTAHLRDVTDDTFSGEVLAESSSRPVVVDFWAPWCGPCRALGPVLERLAAESGGAWLLAKVNVDENPRIASQLGIQGIPAVKAFHRGEVIAEFVGAQPEPAVRGFLEKLGPNPADVALSQIALDQAPDQVRDALRSVLEKFPKHGPTLLALARLELQHGDAAAAVALLDRLDPEAEAKLARELAALRLQIRATQAGPGGDALGHAFTLGATGKHREALELLLGQVAQHRRNEEGERARKAMLELFDVVGPRSELANEFRDRLAAELYR